MLKNKFIPIVLTFLVLLLGTSLAFGFFSGTGDNSAQDLVENSSLEDASDDIANEDADQQILEEVEAVDEEGDNEVLTSNMDVDTHETEDTEETKVTKSEPKTEPERQQQPKELAPQPEKPKVMARATVNGLNVRPDPSTNNERIDVLALGQTVEVLTEQNNWLQVKLADGRVGWISGAYAHKYTPSSGGNGALAGRVIVIDAGHGGSDPGAVGVTGLMEKEVNLDVSLRVAKQLRAAGAEVVMTREADVFIPLAQRVSIAEAARAEIFVSVHANAHPNSAIGGTETYYFGSKSTSNSSLQAASLIQRELVGALRLRDIGVKQANFYVIRQTSMPSVLLELGFLSNAQEEALMRRDDFRQNAADAIVRGLKDFFN